MKMILAKIDLDYFHTCWLTNKGFYNYTWGVFSQRNLTQDKINTASKVTSAKSGAEETHRHNTP